MTAGRTQPLAAPGRKAGAPPPQLVVESAGSDRTW